MRRFESAIAKLLLMGYLVAIVVPALPAEGWSTVASGKVKKVCKRTNAVEQKESGMLLQFAATERKVVNMPQAELLLYCGSSTSYIPPALENELQLIWQQENGFAAFIQSMYSTLFQELDPDPPRPAFC